MMNRWRNWLGRKLPAIGSCFFESILWEFPDKGIDPHSSGKSRPAALTFDDGPHPQSTPQILQLLGKRNIPATFFVCGEHAQQHPDLMRAIVDHGHQIGNHSFRHPDAWKRPAEEIINDLDQSTEAILTISGQLPLWYRPPYGHFTMATIRWARKSQQRMVMWNHLPPDYDLRLPHSEILRLGCKSIPRRPLICLHDNEATFQAGRCEGVFLPLFDHWQALGLEFQHLPPEAAFRTSTTPTDQIE